MSSSKRAPWFEVQLLFQTSYGIRCNTYRFIKISMISEVISPMPALLGQGKSLPELASVARQQPGTDCEGKGT